MTQGPRWQLTGTVRVTGFLWMAVALLAVGIAGLALLGSGTMTLGASPQTPAQRGEWIYRTGTDPDGRPIPYSGGMMMRASCATCHGTDGRGLRTPMFASPNITYRNLTDPAGMVEPDGTRGHVYTDVLIRRAVIRGIDAEGKSLNWLMPRWVLTDREWSDLLAYLKTLPRGRAEGTPVPSPGLPATSPASPASIKAGARQFQAQGCSGCHAIAGTGGTAGPDLTHIGTQMTRSGMEIIITHGRGGMPSFGTIPQADLKALLDYLQSLK